MKRFNPCIQWDHDGVSEYPISDMSLDEDGEYVKASDALELLEALKRVQEDINWMINNQKLLNSFVFDYIETVIDKHK